MRTHGDNESLLCSLLSETDESEIGRFLDYPLPQAPIGLLDESTHQTIKKVNNEIAVKIAFSNIYLLAIEEIVKSFPLSTQANKRKSVREIDLRDTFSDASTIIIAKMWFKLIKQETNTDNTQVLFSSPWRDFRLFVWGYIIMNETKQMMDLCRQDLEKLYSSIILRYKPEEYSKFFYLKVAKMSSPDSIIDITNKRIISKINHADSALQNFLIKKEFLNREKEENYNQ